MEDITIIETENVIEVEEIIEDKEIIEDGEIIDSKKYTKVELQNKCKELGIKFTSNKNKPDLMNLINQRNNPNFIPEIKQQPKKKSIDIYTKSLLKENYNVHKEYYLKRKQLRDSFNVKIRLPAIPEDISENIIKFIMRDVIGDLSCSWDCSGDLSSEIEGKQECKCFTSDGPISFTPSSIWNVLYLLDARNWLDDRFILYRVNLSNSSSEWKNIKMTKSQTFENQCDQGRRPRLNWETLKTHITGHYEQIFDGKIQDIYDELNI